MSLLEDASLKTPLFSLDGHKTKAKCVKVYDGDSVHFVFDIFNNTYRFVCRLYGIDTPELRSKIQMEIDKALAAKDFLSELILDKVVDIECKEFDKYGRLMVIISDNDVIINQLMVDKKYAVPYFGKTKAIWNFV